MKTFSNRGLQAVALIPVEFEQIARKTQPPKKAGRGAKAVRVECRAGHPISMVGFP